MRLRANEWVLGWVHGCSEGRMGRRADRLGGMGGHGCAGVTESNADTSKAKYTMPT